VEDFLNDKTFPLVDHQVECCLNFVLKIVMFNANSSQCGAKRLKNITYEDNLKLF